MKATEVIYAEFWKATNQSSAEQESVFYEVIVIQSIGAGFPC